MEYGKILKQLRKQKNVLKAADNYLSFTAFSYTGLIQQLEFEGYTNDQATYGAKANGY